jgi:hypothetical protein
MSEQEAPIIVDTVEKTPTETPAPTPVVDAASLPTIDEVMNETWARIKARFWSFTLLAAIPVISVLVIGLLLVILFILFPSLFSTLSVHTMSDLKFPFGVFIPLGIAGLAIIAVTVWSMLALYTQAISPVQIPIKQAFLENKSRFFPFIWLSLLLGIIICGSFVFFVIPAVIFSIFFVFWIFTFLVEGERGMAALLKSREYVRGNWWKTLGYMSILFVVSIVLSFILRLTEKVSVGLSGLLNLAYQIFFPMFTAVYLSVLFSKYQIAKKGVTITATKKDKWVYLGTGILGFLLMFGVLAGTVLFFRHNPTMLLMLLK